ncbi:STAS domain-containing protein [uncultured Jatrophihabitans sp.]|uniref:STAS domain-containing protein n=1 Tax=uncultured Jatrophihabitans sp. TaxID=1610747 RepID=UPI0035C9DEA0
MTAELALAIGDTEPASSVRTLSADDWRAVVELAGDFDLASADALRAELDAHLDAGRRVLRLDMSGVTFFDSTAIGVVLGAHKRCAADRGAVIVAAASPSLRRLLRLTRLDAVLLVDSQ